jgi:septal ring factor EnvC (AmiA/AmiB activator)
MAGLDNHIKRVNDKLQQLLKQYQSLQKENERLKGSVKKLEDKNHLLGQDIEQFEQKVNILKASAGKMNDADKKVFEKKISQYMKEVDKCIALLSE